MLSIAGAGRSCRIRVAMTSYATEMFPCTAALALGYYLSTLDCLPLISSFVDSDDSAAYCWRIRYSRISCISSAVGF